MNYGKLSIDSMLCRSEAKTEKIIYIFCGKDPKIVWSSTPPAWGTTINDDGGERGYHAQGATHENNKITD